jgi:hypothetical protein
MVNMELQLEVFCSYARTLKIFQWDVIFKNQNLVTSCDTWWIFFGHQQEPNYNKN